MMVDVRDLSFTYPGAAEPAVADVSFAIERGAVFGFLGPSGAGKSTTQKLLVRLLAGYTGDVTVLGRLLREWGSEYYERVGVSFELPNHFLRLTATENLRYFASLYSGPTRTAAELLEYVGLEADGDMPVSQFSKGMKNRLTVARALLHDPDLLFLDEPTAGLDPGNARRIRDLIRRQQAQGRTVFLTTHDMAAADDLCDRIAFIVDGRIACIDSPRRLKLQFGEPTVRVEHVTDVGVAVEDFALAGIGENAEFIDLLRTDNVRTIHTREATLEDVFLHVTGTSLT